MKPLLIPLALVTEFALPAAQAQNPLDLNRSLTLAPADALSSGTGGAGDDDNAQAVELAKKLSNPAGGPYWGLRLAVMFLSAK